MIARLSAIGDVILTLPLLNALRDRFPKAVLAWVVQEQAAILLRGHKALDELITVPKGWLKSPGTVWRLRRRLRELQPQIAIDPQGLTKSAVVAWLSGARRRLGFRGEWGREISPWLNNELVCPTTEHVVDQGLELIRPLGVERPAIRFDIPEQDADAATAQTMLDSLGLQPGGYAIVNPGAGWVSRLWPPTRFAAVARHLGRHWALPTLVVWAGQGERSMAEAIAAESDGFAQLAPPTRLLELAALTRRGRLFVSSDTGPLHLAVAVGVACVSLHGTTRAARSGPYGPQHRAVQKRYCEGNSRTRRNASSEYMDAIAVEDVCAACDEVLGGERGSWRTRPACESG